MVVFRFLDSLSYCVLFLKDAFYVVDTDNRLRERVLFLFKDNIVICRLKPRTTAETIATTNTQLSSIVSGTVSLINYFKGALVFKNFIPVTKNIYDLTI